MTSKTNKKITLCCALALASSSFNAYASENENEVSQIEVPIYQSKITNSSWDDKDIDASFYDNPFQVSLFNAKNGEDNERLMDHTYTVFGLGVGVIAALTVMPESITNWDKTDADIFKKWYDHVSEGPVWDRDQAWLNYVAHPYFGGVFYQSARKSGYRQWDSFLYSAMMSTFYWEYGIESFAEIPSIQDLVVTPVIGWVYGEWAYQTERDIWLNGGTLFGSEILGNTSLFLLDPVDSIGRNINALFGRDLIKAGTGYFTFNQVKLPYGGATENQVGLKLSYKFGDDSSKALPEISAKKDARAKSTMSTQKDPIDTGVVGISAGATWVNLNEKWGLQDTLGSQISVGLYFNRSFSSRLTYTRADMKKIATNKSVIYENYAIDSQYYFNAQENFRPFVSVGFGEMMSDEERDNKRFAMSAGLGLHYKITNKWALQTDWHRYYSTRTSSSEDQFSTLILYRFSNGERG
ncbi:hypothetical protein PCNPT3_06345 [Psychromonas sp. CNPT3]|uniref:DUF3943 domain-containing protein n=1 Tax=Psychromonas sp. CNPT3 TaxID=314282 RepID=UPI00006E34CF|nr:DUF3943 domain-containing protein [Psychromonas sp. CNPT3]AGH81209.1 hypothetical protein PCNPT3_06345 [Psychromonas sp. CNPT3]